MIKTLLALIGLVVVAGAGWVMLRNTPAPGASTDNTNTSQTSSTTVITDATIVPPGTYVVDTTQSVFNWAAKKPLIQGYINSGTINLKSGSITASDTSATGTFTVDMNTLKVGLTAKDPGMEGPLEKHLKSADFFNVAKYPSATFNISQITPRPDSTSTFMYDIRGTLTMKGVQGDLSFPATIYFKNGEVHANASFEIDRTKWGITFGSGKFFQNLGNNLIDDMVAVSFTLVAKPSAQ